METINYKDYKGPVQCDERVWMSVDDYLDSVGLDHHDYIHVAEQQTFPKLDADEILMRESECSDIWHANIDETIDLWSGQWTDENPDPITELQNLLDAWWEKHKLVNCYMESSTRRVYLDRDEIAAARK